MFVSPGGYICGEQSALIEAMEDHRAEPRNKPPQLETNGLYNKPTLVSNVETYAWVPSIVIHGGPGAKITRTGSGFVLAIRHESDVTISDLEIVGDHLRHLG